MSESEEPRGAGAVFGPTINAIFSPAKAFDALAARPLLAIWPLLWITVGLVVISIVNLPTTRQLMRVGAIEAMAQRGTELDAEQLRGMLETMDRWGAAWAIGGNLFVVISIFLIAVGLWIGASMLGGRTGFSRSLGVASIAGVIHPLVATGFVSFFWALNPPEIRRMQDLFDSLPSLGLDLLFAGSETALWLRTLLSRVDLFNLWWIVLVVIGCERLLELKRGGAVGIAVGIWGLTAALSSFWASMGS